MTKNSTKIDKNINNKKKKREKENKNQSGSDLHSQSRQDKYYRRWEA